MERSNCMDRQLIKVKFASDINMYKSLTPICSSLCTDNLEVADEILDVNERKLEDLDRTEVIKHIHEVITISL